MRRSEIAHCPQEVMKWAFPSTEITTIREERIAVLQRTPVVRSKPRLYLLPSDEKGI